MAYSDNRSGDQSQYSTLEVYESGTTAPYHQQQQEKEAVFFEQNYPEVVPLENNKPGTDGYQSVPPEHYAYAGSSVASPDYYKHDTAGHSPYLGQAEVHQPGPHDHDAKKTICGVSRRKFAIIAIIALVVVIGAVVGAVVGVLVKPKSQDATSNSSGTGSNGTGSNGTGSNGTGSGTSGSNTTTTTIPNVNVLNVSRISATNWTDVNGAVHRIVFFQDIYSSLIARRWDSQNLTWSTSNISDVMTFSTTPLNLAPGSPLASAATDWSLFENQLWFLTKDNYISSVATLNSLNAPNAWGSGFGASQPIQAWAGSRLAAAWQRCERSNCLGTWALAYQSPAGDINIANASDWKSVAEAVDKTSVVANSSLALLPGLKGGTVSRLSLVSQSVSSGTEGSMEKTTYLGKWSADGRVLSELPVLPSTPDFVATQLNHWTEALFLAFLSNGTVTGSRYDGEKTTLIPKITFSQDPPAKFSSVAMTTDAMLYGITNDQILEYSVDSSDPSKLNYVGKVFP